MSKSTVMIGGLGGQGVLLFGQMLAQAGMMRYKNVVYFPNYGGLVRGGASECTVSLSDEVVHSPILLNPDVAVAMSAGYATAFENRVRSGGMLLVDSSIVQNKAIRKDVKVYSIPATAAALELGDKRIANLILLGAYLRIADIPLVQEVEGFLEKKLGAGRNKHMLDVNRKALHKGVSLVEVG